MSLGSSSCGPHQSGGNSESSVEELLGEVGDHDSSCGSQAEVDGAQYWAGVSPWSVRYSNGSIGGGRGGGGGSVVGVLWSGAANPDVPCHWVIHLGAGGHTSMGLGRAELASVDPGTYPSWYHWFKAGSAQ